MKALLVLSILFLFTTECYATTFQLYKNGDPRGEKIEGEIIAKENDYIKIKTKEGIRSIEIKKISPLSSPSTSDLSSWCDFSSLEDFSLRNLRLKIEKRNISEFVAEKEKEIIARMVDKVIERLSELKEQYPELKHFNEPEYFTKGAGIFLYDYNTEAVIDSEKGFLSLYAKSLENGCAIYFRLYSWKDKSRDYLDYFFNTASVGASGVDGFGMELSITINKNREEVSGKIRKVFDEVLRGEFYKSMTEYQLSRKELGTTKEDLLKLITDEDPSVSQKAIGLLAPHKLEAAELAQIRTLLKEGKVTFSVVESILEKQDSEHLPEVYEIVFNMAMEVERSGKDDFVKTPFWGQGWASQARGMRYYIANVLSKSNDPRFINVASNILNNDTVTQHKLFVLDYLSNLPAETSENLLISALDSQDRSIQLKAIEIIGKKKIVNAAGKLKPLLNSFNVEVREKTKEALNILGVSYPMEESKRKLPEFAIMLSNMLWSVGLTEQDIMDACSVSKCMTIPCPPPKDLQLPEGYKVIELPDKCEINYPDGSKSWIQKGDSTTTYWRVPMKTFDSQSIKSSVKLYLETSPEDSRRLFSNRPESLVGVDGRFMFGDVTGIYLLAAALKLKDESLALSIYERLTKSYPSNEAMFEAGLNALAWKFLSRGIEYYQKKKDDDALKNLYALVPFEKYTKPHSYLDKCVKQAKNIGETIESRRKEGKIPIPQTQDQTVLIKYWISQIKEINGQQFSDPGFPSVFFIWSDEENLKTDKKFWEKEIKRMKDEEGIEPPFASHELESIGIAALPALFEAFRDKTLTRTVGWWRSYNPDRYIITVGGAAREIFTVICYDYGLVPPEFMEEKKFDLSIEENYLKAKKQFEEWYKKVSQNIKRLTREEKQKFMEEKIYKGRSSAFVDTPR
ncbi:MAG: hypothetical protein KKF80_00600 [Candidatus Omnitrophica bacterium]|nr:hypothetical protein [Candidatus Omnitrophota bacterium]